MPRHNRPSARLSAANSGKRVTENGGVNQLHGVSWAEELVSLIGVQSSEMSDDDCSEHSTARSDDLESMGTRVPSERRRSYGRSGRIRRSERSAPRGSSRLEGLRDNVPSEYDPSLSPSSHRQLSHVERDCRSEATASTSSRNEPIARHSERAVERYTSGKDGQMPREKRTRRVKPQEQDDEDLKDFLFQITEEERSDYYYRLSNFNADIQYEQGAIDRLNRKYVLHLKARIAHNENLRSTLGKSIPYVETASLEKRLKDEKHFLKSSGLDKDPAFQKEVHDKSYKLFYGHNGEHTAQYQKRLRKKDDEIHHELMMARERYYQVAGAREMFIQAVRNDAKDYFERKSRAPEQSEDSDDETLMGSVSEQIEESDDETLTDSVFGE